VSCGQRIFFKIKFDSIQIIWFGNGMETIDLTPTWKSAVKIYIAVLQNENASYEGKQVAEEELLRLAQIVDDSRKEES